MRRSRSLEIVRAAALAYTASFVAGTVISLQRGYIAEPLGIRTGNTVRQDVLFGNGAALAAPWNMIVQMWVALRLSRRPGAVGRRARAWLAVLAASFLSGSAAEPISHKVLTGELPRPDAIVAVANVVLPAVILSGALAALIDTTGEHS